MNPTKKEISDNDIIDILNKFGFISGNLALQETEAETTTSTTLTKKKVEKKTTTSNISPELKLIEDMYKSGALTKEEYEKAKNRALK